MLIFFFFLSAEREKYDNTMNKIYYTQQRLVGKFQKWNAMNISLHNLFSVKKKITPYV